MKGGVVAHGMRRRRILPLRDDAAVTPLSYACGAISHAFDAGDTVLPQTHAAVVFLPTEIRGRMAPERVAEYGANGSIRHNRQVRMKRACKKDKARTYLAAGPG